MKLDSDTRWVIYMVLLFVIAWVSGMFMAWGLGFAYSGINGAMSFWSLWTFGYLFAVLMLLDRRFVY